MRRGGSVSIGKILVSLVVLLTLLSVAICSGALIFFDLQGPDQFAVSMALIASGVAASGHILWLCAVVLPQRARLRELRRRFPDAIVQPAVSSDHFLADLRMAGAPTGGGAIGIVPVLVVEGSGISIWNGYRRLRLTWHCPRDQIASVTVGRTWYGSWLVHPTVDVLVRVGGVQGVVAFAPTHEDWRFGATMSSRVRVGCVVEAVAGRLATA